MRPLKLALAGPVLAAVVLAANPLCLRAAEPAGSPGAIVLVAHAKKACFSDQILVTGFLVPRKLAVVNVDRDGYKINKVLASVGDRVVSGQTLVDLELQSGGAARTAQQAPGDSRRAARQAPPPKSMELSAPVNGLVMNSSATVGAIASPQAGPLFQIITGNEIELQVEVPSVRISKLKPGAAARIDVGDGVNRIGRVRRVGAEINPQSQLGHARLSVDKDPALRVGMFARATIDASRSCGISVPRAAINYRTQGTSVQVVDNGVIATRRVQLGLASGENIEIRKGLSEGDMVVANAGTSLHDGDKVKTILADTADKTRGQ